MTKDIEPKFFWSFILIAALAVIFTAGCGKKEEPVDHDVSEAATQWLDAKAKARDAEIAKVEHEAAEKIRLAAEKARLVAEEEAGKARIIAEQKAEAEAERIRTHPIRLAAAKEILDNAIPIHEKTFTHVEGLKRSIAISQTSLRTVQENLAGYKGRHSATKAELDIITSRLRSSSIPQAERNLLTQRERVLISDLRGLTMRISETESQINRERMRLEIRENELIEAQKQLMEAQRALELSREKFEKINNEEIN